MSEAPAPAVLSRRLFFALWPPEELRQRVENDTRACIPHGLGRIIPAANFHVTVVFVGEVPQPQVTTVVAAGDATSAAAFTLTLDSLESWPGSDVLVLSGPHTPPALGELIDRLRISLLRNQINLKRQVFRPHITLIRKLPRMLPKRHVPTLEWHVNEFVLVDSQQTDQGSRYTLLNRWPLA